MERGNTSGKSRAHYALIIPALNPDYRLLELVQAINRHSPQMKLVIVDDGSDAQFQPLLEQVANCENCTLCRHLQNQGKGAALQTGISVVIRKFPDCKGIITADSDGQHAPADMLRVALAIDEHPDSIILGTREFSSKNVPLKSRFGNRITSEVFRLVTGRTCSDTQTGLRGIPIRYAEKALEVEGERYEYEMNFLLQAVGWQIPFVELPIQTIYHDDNKGSHFRPVLDAGRIYRIIFRYGFGSLVRGNGGSPLRFLVASLLSFLLDISLFTLLKSLFITNVFAGILVATVTARLFSGVFNFTINRKWVFKAGGNVRLQTAGYLALFFSQMLLSGALVSVLSFLPVPLFLIKGVVDLAIFLVSYQIQRRYIFKKMNQQT